MYTSYIIVGVITVIIGAIAINIILDKEKREKYNTLKTYLIFFIIGVIVHLIVQKLQLDQIYCDKKCRARLGLL
jgi:Na+/glutamate symporter